MRRSVQREAQGGGAKHKLTALQGLHFLSQVALLQRKNT